MRSLRRRQVINSFVSGTRKGAYWGVRTDIADYQLPDALNCPLDRTTQLAELPTRLKRLDEQTQERLINWGYAVCDAALRKHLEARPEAEARVSISAIRGLRQRRGAERGKESKQRTTRQRKSKSADDTGPAVSEPEAAASGEAASAKQRPGMQNPT